MLQIPTNVALNTCRDGAASAFQGSLCQGLKALTAKNSIPVAHLGGRKGSLGLENTKDNRHNNPSLAFAKPHPVPTACGGWFLWRAPQCEEWCFDYLEREVTRLLQELVQDRGRVQGLGEPCSGLPWNSDTSGLLLQCCSCSWGCSVTTAKGTVRHRAVVRWRSPAAAWRRRRLL